MNAQLAPLCALLWLRLRLLSRLGVTRYTRAALRAAPLRLILLVVIVVWAVIFLVLPLIHVLASGSGNVNQRSLLETRLTGLLSLLTIFIFFYAVIGWVTTLTSESDMRLLLLSPITPRLVMAEKFVSVWLGFSLIVLLAFPGILSLGSSLHLGRAYELAGLAVVLLLPLTPVSLAMLFVLGVLRSVPPIRARTVATVIGTLVGAVFYLGTQSVLNRTGSGSGPGLPTLPALLPSSWPGRFLAAVGLGETSTALLYLLAWLSLSILLAGLAIELSARLFVTGSGSYLEVARSARKPGGRVVTATAFADISSESKRGRLARLTPAWWPLFQKEWLSLRRDPQRLALIAYPLLIVGYLSYRSVSSGGITGDPGFGARTGYFYLTLILASVLVTGSFAPTIINREGRSLYLLSLAPLTPRAILVAKWAICTIPPALLTEAVLVLGIITLHLSFIAALVTALVLAVLAIALAGLCLTVNLVWPKLGDPSRRPASAPAQILGFISEMAVGMGVWVFLALTTGVLPGGPLAVLVGATGLVLIPGLAILISLLLGPLLLRNLLTSERARS